MTSVHLRTPFEPTARCINDTEKRQMVTKSGLPRSRCCECHLHHKWAMNSPAAVREFFKTVLQQVGHFKFDVIAGDANAAAYKYYRNQEYQDLYDSPIAVMLREMQREVNNGHPFESGLHIDFPPTIIRLSFTQQMILIVASWLSFHGGSQSDPES